MTPLSLSCLGPFQASLNGQPITAFGTDKVRALLVFLAVEAEHPHRRERLAGLLWSDQPEERALHNLRQALSTLRKALATGPGEPPFILVTPEGVQFNPAAPAWLDVKAFSSKLDEALRYYQRHSATGRLHIRCLQQAVVLYRGHFLDEFSLSGGPLFDEWATMRREALHHRLVEALTLLAEYHERRGEYTLARQAASRLVELAPWDETAHAQLMRLLALDGQWSPAQAQYQALRRYLQQEMGLEPATETAALFEQIRSGAARNSPPTPRFPSARHNLPMSPTPFIGRETDLDDLTAALVDPQCRLLTLTGPGGIGKTRLALEVARQQVGIFADGVFFIPLISVGSGEQLLPALADAVGFMFSDRETHQIQLRDYLRGKNMLLVLDNFEHLLQSQTGGAILSNILQAAPGVMLLVTSRERLNLHEECLYPLDGLTYPPAGETRLSAQVLAAYSAPALFLSCIRRQQRDFSATPDDIAAIVRICQLLEGLPLGVELATAATWKHTCGEVAEKIAHNLDILATAASNASSRHRSLRAAFDTSWALLTLVEQAACHRLALFRGGFEAEAAQQVADVSPDVLGALLDKSLLHRHSANRYDIHEAIRQYAANRLAGRPDDSADILARHATYYAQRLTEFNPDLKGANQAQALAALHLESENIRLAWSWLLDHGKGVEIAQSADSLYLFYDTQSRFGEGMELLAAAAERLKEWPAPQGPLGIVLARLGALAERTGNYELARTALSRSREIFELQLNIAELAFCLVSLGNLAQRSGAYAEAQHLAQASLAHYREVSDHHGEANALLLLGVVSYRLGQIAEPRSYLERSLAASRLAGNPRRLVGPLNTLADILCHLGDYAQARELFNESLKISRDLGDQYHVGVLLNNLGTVDQVLGEYSSAEARYRQSRDICHDIGDRIGEGMAWDNLGEVACARGAYTESRQFAQQALHLGRDLQDHWMILASLNALAEAAAGEGDYAAAWSYLAEAARLELETQTLQMLARTAVDAGGLLLKQGRPHLGAQVLAAALQHPACQDDIRQKAERWLRETGLTLPETPSFSLEEAVAKAMETA